MFNKLYQFEFSKCARKKSGGTFQCSPSKVITFGVRFSTSRSRWPSVCSNLLSSFSSADFSIFPRLYSFLPFWFVQFWVVVFELHQSDFAIQFVVAAKKEFVERDKSGYSFLRAFYDLFVGILLVRSVHCWWYACPVDHLAGSGLLTQFSTRLGASIWPRTSKVKFPGVSHSMLCNILFIRRPLREPRYVTTFAGCFANSGGNQSRLPIQYVNLAK